MIAEWLDFICIFIYCELIKIIFNIYHCIEVKMNSFLFFAGFLYLVEINREWESERKNNIKMKNKSKEKRTLSWMRNCK